MKTKSEKSINQCESVIQTIDDIIKAHGGEIKVNTNEGEGLPDGQAGSEFIISLPVN